jgi:hypothetical protein
MNDTVLSTIANLLGEFTPNPIPIPPLDSKVKLDDPFIHAFNLLQQTEEDKADPPMKQAFRLYSEERHYSHNISTLLYYFLYYFRHYRDDEWVQWDFHSRLTLDVEQLVTNTRSFLDSTFKLALLFSDNAPLVRGKKRESFGKFAEWATRDNLSFRPPLSFLSEVIPWGLTIRRVRDDYIHRGQESEPYWDSDEVYFYPYISHRKVRPMPDIFYGSHPPQSSMSDAIKPIYLRKFLVYVVAPVFAVELLLGRYLTELFRSRYGPWSFHEEGCPFSAGPNIQALYELVCQNRACLESEIYKNTYFT